MTITAARSPGNVRVVESRAAGTIQWVVLYFVEPPSL